MLLFPKLRREACKFFKKKNLLLQPKKAYLNRLCLSGIFWANICESQIIMSGALFPTTIGHPQSTALPTPGTSTSTMAIRTTTTRLTLTMSVASGDYP